MLYQLELLACKPLSPLSEQVVATLPFCETLFRFAMACMFATKTTVLAEFQFVRRRTLVLCRRIIPLLALLASKGHNNSHLTAP